MCVYIFQGEGEGRGLPQEFVYPLSSSIRIWFRPPYNTRESLLSKTINICTHMYNMYMPLPSILDTTCLPPEANSWNNHAGCLYPFFKCLWTMISFSLQVLVDRETVVCVSDGCLLPLMLAQSKARFPSVKHLFTVESSPHSSRLIKQVGIWTCTHWFYLCYCTTTSHLIA